MSDDNGADEFSALDDIAFLDERRRVREALEQVPEPEHDQDPDLVSRYERMTREFDRRAASAWTGGAQ